MKLQRKKEADEVLTEQFKVKIIYLFCHCSVCGQRLQFEYFNPSRAQISEFPFCMSCGSKYKTQAHTLH